MKKILSILLALLMLSSLVACSSQSTNEKNTENTNNDTSWTKVQDKGELVVGNCPEYPPFSSRNPNGEIEGFDSDYAKALGDALGVKVTIKDTAWEGLVAGLQKGDHDIIISCMSPEEAIAASENVNMSIPYYELSEIIVVRSDEESIKSKEDLTDKIIGVQANTTSEVAVDSLKDMDIIVKDITKYNRNQEALIDLINGRVDAVVVGYAYAATKAKDNTELKIINDPVRSVDIVVVINKGADDLTDKINEAINTVKQNGAYDTIHKKWLGLE
ncbi:transporter substrate-binding domain-containing protein [Alkaliphilus serpentinus]|nr:transporter substrate-binding domain-containing protein [Alkaliphilus serpentinus]